MTRGQRDDGRTGDDVVARVAHALTPSEWSGPALIAGIVVFATVGAVTVVQRALVADSATGWVVTAVHGTVVAVVVPLLSARTVREWRAARRGRGAHPPSGSPE